MKITELKKLLNSMKKNELAALVCKLYKASKQAQSLVDVELCGKSVEEQLVTDCKKRIHAAFFGSRLSLKNARTVISDFKKVSENQENVAELMLYYVECGVEYTSMYGDIDEAFYYTNRIFYNKLKKAKMKQSMSRVAKCIDNGPMEGFWGILKRERYYGRRFTCRENLVQMIENYISYYNNRRVQRNLGILTPMEKHYGYPLAA